MLGTLHVRTSTNACALCGLVLKPNVHLVIKPFNYSVTRGRGENPDRTGPTEVVISVSTCREIAYLDREVAIASSHCGIA